jgi:hypothetical protein
MTDETEIEGVYEALIVRFEHHRLPELLSIKTRVDAGESLSDTDIGFLERVMTDAMSNKHLVDSMPKCQDLFARVAHLYHEISEKALANERAA